MKKTSTALAVIGLSCAVSNAAVNFTWGTGTGTYRCLFRESNQPLTPYETYYSGGACFVQLVLAYDGVIHPASPEGNGVSGGDQVVATSWLGRGMFVTSGGEFDAEPLAHDLPAGSRIFMRAWSAPSPDYNGSASHLDARVPAGVGVGYGDSPLYTTSKDPADPVPGGPMEDFTLDDTQANIYVIPEPATVGLLAVGLGVLALRRRLRPA